MTWDLEMVLRLLSCAVVLPFVVGYIAAETIELLRGG